MLDGVSLDDRVVRDLMVLLERPLGKRLVPALFVSARIVALTHEERLAVLGALDRERCSMACTSARRKRPRRDAATSTGSAPDRCSTSGDMRGSPGLSA